MKTTTFFRLLIFTIFFVGCTKTTNDLSAFSPEITNMPDNFQLQATNVVNVSTSITYNWSNSGVKANIDKSGVLTSGDASVTITDASGLLVYTGDLKTTGSATSIAGTAGTWKIVLLLSKANGTLSLRVQKGG